MRASTCGRSVSTVDRSRWRWRGSGGTSNAGAATEVAVAVSVNVKEAFLDREVVGRRGWWKESGVGILR